MVNVLFVCTGNVCRSPMAAAFAAAALSEAPGGVAVKSAGLLGAGRAGTDEMVKTMASYGLDVSNHISSGLQDLLDPSPDLIVAMAREHAREVVQINKELFHRTFTLKDLVRRASDAGPREPKEDLGDYLRRLGSGRRLSELAGMSGKDDIADPIGKPLGAYRRTAREIEELIREMAGLFWPDQP